MENPNVSIWDNIEEYAAMAFPMKSPPGSDCPFSIQYVPAPNPPPHHLASSYGGECLFIGTFYFSSLIRNIPRIVKYHCAVYAWLEWCCNVYIVIHINYMIRSNKSSTWCRPWLEVWGERSAPRNDVNISQGRRQYVMVTHHTEDNVSVSDCQTLTSHRQQARLYHKYFTVNYFLYWCLAHLGIRPCHLASRTTWCGELFLIVITITCPIYTFLLNPYCHTTFGQRENK